MKIREWERITTQMDQSTLMSRVGVETYREANDRNLISEICLFDGFLCAMNNDFFFSPFTV